MGQGFDLRRLGIADRYAKKTVSVDGQDLQRRQITSRSTARLAQSTPASLRPRRARSSRMLHGDKAAAEDGEI
jgi:hypothetical protein